MFCPGLQGCGYKRAGRDAVTILSLIPLPSFMIIKTLFSGKSLGLRINPECSTQGDHAIMTPVLPVPVWELQKRCLYWKQRKNRSFLMLWTASIFHTLCEQNADDLAKTLEAVEEALAHGFLR